MSNKKSKTGIHIWNSLNEYKPEFTDVFEETEGGLEKTVDELKKMEPNEYLIVATLPPSEKNTFYFLKYLDKLKRKGIDVGNGNTEYGYKMPLPKKDDTERKLIVFRRK